MIRDNIRGFKERASKIDNIRFLLIDFEGEEEAFYRISLDRYFFVLGLENLESHNLLADIFYDKKDLVIKSKQVLEEPFHHISIELVTDKNDRISLLLAEIGLIKENIGYFSGSILSDKDRIVRGRKLKVEKPIDSLDMETFNRLCLDFFISAIDIGYQLNKNNIVNANNIYRKNQDILLEISKLYIGVKYDFSVKDAHLDLNLDKYLEKEIYLEYQEIFKTDNKEDFWTSIFKACQIFRKMGLAISRKLDYPYPKQADVNSMNYMRYLYQL